MSKNKVLLGAIDIGSNAIRMVIASHDENGLKVLKKYRFPIRLGTDVFSKGLISAKNLKLSARTFKKFKEITEKHGINHIRAVGTSALREAKNQTAFTELIMRKSNIAIEIIDGVVEGQLIHSAVKREIDLDRKNVLLIDVGGGSVELSVCSSGLMSATQSFPFGTVRTLELIKSKGLTELQVPILIGEYLQPLANFINSQNQHGQYDFAVGTGGNLESLGKLKPLLTGDASPTFLTYGELSKLIQILQTMSTKQRIEKLKLRPDRADVILPAAYLVQSIIRQAKIQKILIPHVGLKDGILWSMVQEKSYLANTLG